MPSKMYRNPSPPPNTYIAHDRRGTALRHANICITYEIGYILPAFFDQLFVLIMKNKTYYNYLFVSTTKKFL